jgi:hypothetical protein
MFITNQHIDQNRRPSAASPDALRDDYNQVQEAKRYFTELTRDGYENEITDTHYVHTVDREARYSFPCLKGVDLVYVSRQDDNDVEFVAIELID